MTIIAVIAIGTAFACGKRYPVATGLSIGALVILSAYAVGVVQ